MRIKESRKEKGLTGPQIAKLLNISAPHYYDMENGKKRIHAELLSNLADILETSTDYLLSRTDDPTSPKERKPVNYEEIVLSAPTLPDALRIAAELQKQHKLSSEWLENTWVLAIKKFGIPEPVKASEAAAHGSSIPGTGSLDENDGDE